MASLACYSLAIKQISGCVLSERYKKVVPKIPMKINRCPGHVHMPQ